MKQAQWSREGTSDCVHDVLRCVAILCHAMMRNITCPATTVPAATVPFQHGPHTCTYLALGVGAELRVELGDVGKLDADVAIAMATELAHRIHQRELGPILAGSLNDHDAAVVPPLNGGHGGVGQGETSSACQQSFGRVTVPRLWGLAATLLLPQDVTGWKCRSPIVHRRSPVGGAQRAGADRLDVRQRLRWQRDECTGYISQQCYGA